LTDARDDPLEWGPGTFWSPQDPWEPGDPLPQSLDLSQDPEAAEVRIDTIEHLTGEEHDRRLLMDLLTNRPPWYPVRRILNIRLRWFARRHLYPYKRETAEHREIVKTLRQRDRVRSQRMLFHHSPNEETEARRRKHGASMGVSTGFPDLVFLQGYEIPGHFCPGHGQEIKTVRWTFPDLDRVRLRAAAGSKKDQQILDQVRWLEDMRSQGWVAEFTRGAGESLMFVDWIYPL